MCTSGLDTQIQLSGGRAQGSPFLTKTPGDSNASERPQSEKPRPGASLAGNAENNSGIIRNGHVVRGVKCCAREYGLFRLLSGENPWEAFKPKSDSFERRTLPAAWRQSSLLGGFHSCPGLWS